MFRTPIVDLRHMNRPTNPVWTPLNREPSTTTGKLHQDFSISVGGSNFLDLDSSTPKKFSRHLILHLPGDQVCRRGRRRLVLPLSVAAATAAAAAVIEGEVLA